MADLVVGLAKSVVEGTVTKAQSAIEEEAKLRQSAQRDLVFITGEFQMMQSFLNVADEERLKNTVVRTWVRQIRELAYDVEDCIEFVVHLDKKSTWTGLWRMVPSCIAPSRNLDQAVDEIEQLKARVEDVSRRNARYSLISDSGSKPATVQQEPAPRAAVGATAFNLLVGATDTGRRQQGDLTQLLGKNDADQVISLWGTDGDLGIASIVWKAYNDPEIRQNFTRRAWVKLIHPFNPREFVRCLTAQFHVKTCQQQEEGIIAADVLAMMEDTHGNNLEEFVRQVNQERYLIVLEDLCTMAEWEAISKFFPKRKNGSCIIVCTQQFEVASLSVGNSFQVLDLNQFSVEHCVYAFFKARDEDKGVETDKTSTSKNRISICTSKKNAATEWMEHHHPLHGRDSEMSDLREYTTTALFKSFQVMSVWGIAGVGKSALVKNLFCERILKKSSPFQEYGWVDVSHPFNLRDFSRSLFLNFRSEYLQAKGTAYHDTMGSKNPIVECREILKRQRCLVVIDGLQSTKEWDLIQTELVSGSNSKNVIIVITTESNIAKRCRGDKGEELVFNVKGLEADAAFDLFKKEVSRKNPLPVSLSDGEVAELHELISKCGGLPKVIIGIAGLLTTKTVGWMDIARSINFKFMQELETNGEFDSLRNLFGWMHSYFRNCPDSLKPYIFYLSIFPRDFIIRRRRLITRWIAEAYSRDNHDESAEENGEKHFSDLLDLSIIQQPSALRLGDMRMVLCQVNGFVREYIVSRRMEENLVFELGGSCALTTQRTGRHLVVLKSWDRDRIVFESMDFSRLRSLTVFGEWQSFLISESMKLLRVLDLENASGLKADDLEKIVKHLRRLKFLSLRGCREICRLPSSLGDLRQLQTLDVRHTSIVTLPRNIIKIQRLQYIRAGTTVPIPVSSWLPKLFCKRRHLVGVEVHRGIGELKALHTLGVVNVSDSGGEAFLQELSGLTQLRKLGVSGINRKNSKKFFDAISVHVHLESLSVLLDMNNQGCLDGMPLPLKLENLRSLKLYGLEDKLPVWSDHESKKSSRYTLPQKPPSNQLTKLSKLHLEMTILVKDDIEFIGKLPKLSVLSLRVKQLEDGNLDFRVLTNGQEDDCFDKVKILEIACSCSSLPVVTFGSKTMKNLELLKVDCCSESTYQFCGLEHLSQLKEVVLVKGSNQIHEILQQVLKNQLANHPNEKKPVVNLQEPHSF